jgi:hypothetical protein
MSNNINHPLERVFDIKEGTTDIAIIDETRDLTLVEDEKYDDKDNEIERQLEEVYTISVNAAREQLREIELIDPRFRSRAQETSAQMLNTALTALKEKRSLKEHKDRLNVAIKQVEMKQGDTVNNTAVILADRNDILKALKNEDITDAEEIS